MAKVFMSNQEAYDRLFNELVTLAHQEELENKDEDAIFASIARINRIEKILGQIPATEIYQRLNEFIDSDGSEQTIETIQRYLSLTAAHTK